MFKLVLVAILALVSPAFAQQSLIIPPSIVGTSARGQIPGTATNDNASAGNVGEYIEASVLAGSAVSLTAFTAADITFIDLTAGDWDVSTYAEFNPAATTTVTNAQISVSTTSATVDVIRRGFDSYVAGSAFPSPISVQANNVRISVNATTRVYMVASVGFAVSTLTAYGRITARRLR